MRSPFFTSPRGPPAAASQPADELVGLHGPDWNPAAARLQRPKPLRALRVAVESGREDEQQSIRVAPFQERLERVVAGRSGASRGQAQLEQPARAKQRQIGGRSPHVIPVGAALEEVHLALGNAHGARSRADRVGCLSREQRLVAGHQVSREKVLLQMGDEGIGGELQLSPP